MGGWGSGVTFHCTVRVVLVLGLEEGWQKQGVLGEHHVDHWQLDELRAHRAFWKIQEL